MRSRLTVVACVVPLLALFTAAPAVAQGGGTTASLTGYVTDADGVSLCHWHHNRAHDPHYTTTYHPNGDVTFHRRT